MKYKIDVYELWVRSCEVEADDKDHAVEIMEGGDTQNDVTEYVKSYSVDVELVKE